MKFIKIEDKVQSYRDEGFESGDRIIALLSSGEVKHGTLYFVESYQTLFEVQIIVEQSSGKSFDLFEALVCKVELH